MSHRSLDHEMIVHIRWIAIEPRNPPHRTQQARCYRMVEPSNAFHVTFRDRWINDFRGWVKHEVVDNVML